jgi:pimeloyl-ACP methyl ester carboxylesterase
MHVTEVGEGPPLLLLHGWPQDGSMWDPLIEPLATSRRVLVPDLRGFGRSDAPRGSYAKHELVSDVLALLDAEGIDRATVVGHDWGGWTAWLLALEHPERVERFAALDIPPPWRFDVSPARLPRELLFGTYQYLISTPLIGERLVSSRRVVRTFIERAAPRMSRADADRYAAGIARPDRAHVSVSLYREFLLREVPAIARGTYTSRELTVPGLSIMGAESAVTKLVGAPEPEPNLRVEQIAEVGHFVVDEAPGEVLALLEPFLA